MWKLILYLWLDVLFFALVVPTCTVSETTVQMQYLNHKKKTDVYNQLMG